MKTMNSDVLKQITDKLVAIGQKRVKKSESLLASINLKDEMIKIAAKKVVLDPIEKRLRTGYIHTLSKDATQFTTLPTDIKDDKKKKPRFPGSAMSKFPSGSETNTPYVGEQHGGDQTPAASTISGRKDNLVKTSAKKALSEIITELKQENQIFVDVRDIVMRLSQKDDKASFDIESVCKTLADEGITLIKVAEEKPKCPKCGSKDVSEIEVTQPDPTGATAGEEHKGYEYECEKCHHTWGQKMTTAAEQLVPSEGPVEPQPEEYGEALQKGIQIEMEHQDTIEAFRTQLQQGNDLPDEKVAEMIATDHLKENPAYYDEMMERTSADVTKKIYPKVGDKVKIIEQQQPLEGYGFFVDEVGVVDSIGVSPWKINVNVEGFFIQLDLSTGDEVEIVGTKTASIITAKSVAEIKDDIEQARKSRSYAIERSQEKDLTPEEKEKYRKTKVKWEKAIDRLDRELSRAMKAERKEEREKEKEEKMTGEQAGEKRVGEDKVASLNIKAEDFEEKDRVELVKTTDEYTKLQPGTQGVVQSVDDAGTIHVKWDTGETLGMVPEGGDIIKHVGDGELVQGLVDADMIITAQEPLTDPAFEVDKFLSPTEYQEIERLIGMREKAMEAIFDREKRNMQEGKPGYTGIDYTEIEMLNAKITEYQNLAKGRKGTEVVPGAPEEEPMAPEGMPPEPKEAPGKPGGAEKGVLEKRPEELPMFATKRHQLVKRAEVMSIMNRNFEISPIWHIDENTQTFHGYDVHADSGEKLHIPTDKHMSREELKNEIAKKLTKGIQRKGMEKDAVTCQDFPEVCKNCRNCTIPSGYRELTLLDHRDKPFCSVSDSAKDIGFRWAYMRECRGYDPILKEVKQKVETPGEVIFEEFKSKGDKPILKKSAGYEDTPKNEPATIETEQEAKERGKVICPKCVEKGFFIPRGKVHPAHDWHSLWNCDFQSISHTPKGICMPKTMAFQSQPDSGLNQFDTEKNRIVK
jgi:hypothetical protein